MQDPSIPVWDDAITMQQAMDTHNHRTISLVVDITIPMPQGQAPGGVPKHIAHKIVEDVYALDDYLTGWFAHYDAYITDRAMFKCEVFESRSRKTTEGGPL